VLFPPAKVRRFEELSLLWFFARGVLADWACQVDPLKAVEQAIDVAGPMISSRERRRFERQLEAALADPEPNRPQTAMLWAATRWLCSLEIPRDERGLWRGPPLFQRIRPIGTAVIPRAYP
jgi:hypothetical protein